jgi:hypothetical protein
MYILTHMYRGEEITAELPVPKTLSECVEHIAHYSGFVRAIEIDGDKFFDATQNVLEALAESQLDSDWSVSLRDCVAPIHHDWAARQKTRGGE